MQELLKTIILLIRSAITGERVVIFENTDWEKVFKISKVHQVAPIIYYGIENSKLDVSKDIKERFFNSVMESLLVEQNQFLELERVSQKLEQNQIDYLPLKGCVIKKLYPKSEMRLMGDMDILVRQNQFDEVCKIMEALGYVQDEITENVSAYKKGFVNFEIHKALYPSDDPYYGYFKDNWEKAFLKDDNKCRYVFSNEDAFIFDFLHLVKHYLAGGVGLRQFIDLWLMLKKIDDLNLEYVVSELKKLELEKFYNNIVATLEVWFGNKEATDITDFITEITFKSGSFGTTAKRDASVAMKTVEKKGKGKNNIFRKILLTIFLPFSAMKTIYPVLEKAPILLPVMWVVRWFKTLFFKRKNISRQINRIQSSTNAAVDSYLSELEYVGISKK